MNNDTNSWPELPSESGTIWDISKCLARLAPRKVAHPNVVRMKEAAQLYALVQWRIRAVLFYYRSITEACRRFPRISKQIVACIQKLQALPPTEYCRWRSSPKRVFGGKSAQDWFAEKDLPELERALALRAANPEELK